LLSTWLRVSDDAHLFELDGPMVARNTAALILLFLFHLRFFAFVVWGFCWRPLCAKFNCLKEGRLRAASDGLSMEHMSQIQQDMVIYCMGHIAEQHVVLNGSLTYEEFLDTLRLIVAEAYFSPVREQSEIQEKQVALRESLHKHWERCRCCCFSNQGLPLHASRSLDAYHAKQKAKGWHKDHEFLMICSGIIPADFHKQKGFTLEQMVYLYDSRSIAVSSMEEAVLKLLAKSGTVIRDKDDGTGSAGCRVLKMLSRSGTAIFDAEDTSTNVTSDSLVDGTPSPPKGTNFSIRRRLMESQQELTRLRQEIDTAQEIRLEQSVEFFMLNTGKKRKEVSDSCDATCRRALQAGLQTEKSHGHE